MRIPLVRGWAPLLAALASWPALAGAPFSFDATPGRLPKEIVPLDYAIAVVPDIDAGTIAGTES
ncbi:MAG TPA: hypothetical protein VM713_00835, partial [Steroidobacteraceae bacterium]|nr:hypothetical protein [Steroidobacteraceae bacterium]